mgnify:CR=1 FL=1
MEINIQNVNMTYPNGKIALKDLNLDLKAPSLIGLLGPNGAGKSTLMKLLVAALMPTGGSILMDGQPLSKTDRLLKARLGYLPQDFGLFDELTVTQFLDYMAALKGISNPKAAIQKTIQAVNLEEKAKSKIRTLSGGQRQRINVARALALKPKIIVCDEPVSALDVSIQAQVLNLFNRLQRQHNLTYIFISHDLGVIKHVSDRIAIMYLGRVVELCRAAQIYENPLHPYTKALLSAIPPESPFQKKERIVLKGEIPSPIGDQVGCPLAGRCPNCTERCTREIPTLQDIGDGHQVACFLYH